MKNNMIEMIRESCTVTAPDKFQALSFADAEQYKNSTPKISPKKNYITAAVIYAAACVALFVAIPFIIGGGTDPDAPIPANSDVQSSVENTGDAEIEAVHDFDGATFKFLHMGKKKQHNSSERLKYSNARDVYLNPCDWSSDIINEAVAERNEMVEAACNIKLVFEDVEGVIKEARTRMRSGQCDFNAILSEGNSGGDLVTDHVNRVGGYLADYHSIENIDLTKSYWLPNTVEGLTANDKMYLGGGLITMDPIAHSDIIYYNRDLADELEVESPYELAESGQWTYDKFLDMIVASEKDLNSDGVVTDSDQWGGVYKNDLRDIIIESAPFINRNDDGSYSIVCNTEKTSTAYEKYKDTIESLSTGDKFRASDNIWDDISASRSFKDGRTLFMKGSTDYVRNMYNVNFGIVPLPVLEAGDEYVTYGSGNSNMISIPRDNPDMEITGAVLDYMAKASEDILLPAYTEELFEADTEGKEQNIKMFGIIKDSIRYDWTEMFVWGSAYDYDEYNRIREGSFFSEVRYEHGEERIKSVLTWFEK